MRRLIPSIGSLIAFEAVARHLSFSKAADDLSLTQSAVSRQIGTLEQMLGMQLFERRPHRLVLTETGATYLADVIDALERLSASTVRVMSNRKGVGVVQVVSTPTFASIWLLPRLPRFYKQHPEIQIMLRTRSTPFNLLESNVDIAINMSVVTWPGTIADPLVSSPAVAVCSAQFKERYRLEVPNDLIGKPLIQHYSIPDTWSEWLAEMGVAHPAPLVGQQFDQFVLATQAAVAGLGIVIMPRLFVEAELRARELIEPFAKRSKRTFTYMMFRSEDRQLPALQIFKDWLLDEAKPREKAAPRAAGR
ncbi:transcriptional regulator, LysR family [Rhizobiales bacterium GAS113]|nr:transcriptional regulator, LysR family [Rhizobiales bacterium GAS113]